MTNLGSMETKRMIVKLPPCFWCLKIGLILYTILSVSKNKNVNFGENIQVKNKNLEQIRHADKKYYSCKKKDKNTYISCYRKPYCNENPIYVCLSWEFRGLSPNFQHSGVCERFIYPRIRPLHIFPAAE
jgi:hypothetical protein